MRYTLRALRAAFVGLLLMVISSTPIVAKTKTLAPDVLPAIVQDSLALHFPGAAIESVERIKAQGSTHYKITVSSAHSAEPLYYDKNGSRILDSDALTKQTLLKAISDALHKRTPAKRAKFQREKPDLYGYIQAFYKNAYHTGIDSLVDNTNFRVMRVRVGVKGQVSPLLSYAIEIDPRSPEITGVLRDAYIDCDFSDHQVIRIGQQKTTFGYENLASSTELYTVNRTELSEGLGRGFTLRDIGLGLLGHIPLNEKFRIENDFTIVNGNGMNQQFDDTPAKSFWGRVGLKHRTENSWTRFGISAADGDFMEPGDLLLDPSDDVQYIYQRFGCDFETDQKPFFFAAEFANGQEEAQGESVTVSGWYALLAAKLFHRAGPLVRYEIFDEDFKRSVFGAYYGNPKDKVRLLLNYEYRESFESLSGEFGRGDDKLIVWLQLKF